MQRTLRALGQAATWLLRAVLWLVREIGHAVIAAVVSLVVLVATLALVPPGVPLLAILVIGGIAFIAGLVIWDRWTRKG